jgi:hypothetical protein
MKIPLSILCIAFCALLAAPSAAQSMSKSLNGSGGFSTYHPGLDVFEYEAGWFLRFSGAGPNRYVIIFSAPNYGRTRVPVGNAFIDLDLLSPLTIVQVAGPTSQVGDLMVFFERPKFLDPVLEGTKVAFQGVSISASALQGHLVASDMLTTVPNQVTLHSTATN